MHTCIRVTLCLLLALPVFGAQYVSTQTPSIHLWASDAGSGVAAYELWEGIGAVERVVIDPAVATFALDRQVTLSTGDGVKVVYVRYADAAENWSATYSVEVVVDTIPPVGGLEYVALPGDINLDGEVGFADFNILRENWGRELGG